MSDIMAVDLPSWVPEFEEEYNKFKKKNKIWIIGLSLVITSYVIMLFFKDTIKNDNILTGLIFLFMGGGAFIFGLYYKIKLPSPSKYLASMIYSIGFHLEKNSDSESNIYISKIENYLKNCDAIIKNIYFTLRGATYVNTTRDYLRNLNQITELLNEYYANYPKYKIDKSIVSKKIIQLADIMHGDKGYVTNEHIDVIESLIKDLTGQDVKEKPLYISKIERSKSMLRTSIGGLPYSFKLIAYIIVVFLVIYVLINNAALSKNISQDTAFGIAVTGGIAALVPALMIKDHILK